MHGFMRMYWCKKILEWTPSPEQALRTALYLNDRYFVDGRFVNSPFMVFPRFDMHALATRMPFELLVCQHTQYYYPQSSLMSKFMSASMQACNVVFVMRCRDPNGYVGCAWSIAGIHDNAWTERPVFGKVRFMNYEVRCLGALLSYELQCMIMK